MSSEDEEYFHGLAEELETAIILEGEAKEYVGQCVYNSKAAEAQVVAEGYASGSITGKNAETRARQETQLLYESTAYQDARKVLGEAEVARTKASAHVAASKEFIKLLTAWMYSQGGRV